MCKEKSCQCGPLSCWDYPWGPRRARCARGSTDACDELRYRTMDSTHGLLLLRRAESSPGVLGCHDSITCIESHVSRPIHRGAGNEAMNEAFRTSDREGMGICDFICTSRASPEDNLRGRPPQVDFLQLFNNCNVYVHTTRATRPAVQERRARVHVCLSIPGTVSLSACACVPVHRT